ncbi:MAG TPA: ATP-binding protein [Solirubrobacteraceae bacterium]|nr:ATP-binding protein [Solirubrobacteraceae bacterium]
MDQRLNPYTPGSGIKPKRLAGRDADLEAFRLLLQRLADGEPERSLIYSGLRGVGKTVLLLEFETLAREAGWACNEVEEVGSGDFRQVFAELAYQMLLSMSRRKRMHARATAALGVLKAFALGLPGGITARIEVDASKGTADSGDPERDLAALLAEVGQVAQTGGIGAVFFLDEMQGLDKVALEAVCMAMNRAGQRSLPVALVGAGLPPLPRLLRAAKPYAERMFAYHELDRLSDAAARLALIAPAAQLQVEYEPRAVELIVEASAGYPHFLQEYGRVLWNEVEASPIHARDVKSAEALVSEALSRRFFRDRFETASDAEQRYLCAMAELGEEPARTAEVARRAGYKDIGSTSLLRENLMRKDLIYSPRRGLIAFTVPLFAGYVREHHPLDRLDT